MLGADAWKPTRGTSMALDAMRTTSLLFLLFALAACSVRSNSADFLAKQVAEQVENLTKAPASQERALHELEAMGDAAVPFIVGHLGDTRPLAEPRMSLVNHASDAFEGLRHYGPDTVHDALSAVLNQITGQSFEFVYNGATAEERNLNRTHWVTWCQARYHESAPSCAKSI